MDKAGKPLELLKIDVLPFEGLDDGRRSISSGERQASLRS
jgi:hypothetical protein